MRVLIACEESQEVCKAFRALGHEAYSCDIQPPSGGHPEWHIQGDALKILSPVWDSLYRAVIGDEVHEGLTYQEAIELMIRADERRGKNA